MKLSGLVGRLARANMGGNDSEVFRILEAVVAVVCYIPSTTNGTGVVEPPFFLGNAHKIRYECVNHSHPEAELQKRSPETEGARVLQTHTKCVAPPPARLAAPVSLYTAGSFLHIIIGVLCRQII